MVKNAIAIAAALINGALSSASAAIFGKSDSSLWSRRPSASGLDCGSDTLGYPSVGIVARGRGG